MNRIIFAALLLAAAIPPSHAADPPAYSIQCSADQTTCTLTMVLVREPTTPTVPPVLFSVPPPSALFRVPAGWSNATVTSSADTLNVPAACARPSGKPNATTLSGATPIGPYTYTMCATDGAIEGWWRITPPAPVAASVTVPAAAPAK